MVHFSRKALALALTLTQHNAGVESFVFPTSTNVEKYGHTKLSMLKEDGKERLGFDEHFKRVTTTAFASAAFAFGLVAPAWSESATFLDFDLPSYSDSVGSSTAKAKPDSGIPSLSFDLKLPDEKSESSDASDVKAEKEAEKEAAKAEKEAAKAEKEAKVAEEKAAKAAEAAKKREQREDEAAEKKAKMEAEVAEKKAKKEAEFAVQQIAQEEKAAKEAAKKARLEKAAADRKAAEERIRAEQGAVEAEKKMAPKEESKLSPKVRERVRTSTL